MYLIYFFFSRSVGIHGAPSLEHMHFGYQIYSIWVLLDIFHSQLRSVRSEATT